MLYRLHLYEVPKHFHYAYAKVELTHIIVFPYSLLPSDPGNHQHHFSVSIDLTLLDISYTWDSMICEGFQVATSGNESTCQCRRHKRHGLYPWVGKIPWRRAWQPTPVSLLREAHGQRSLAGYIVHGVAKNQTWLKWLCTEHDAFCIWLLPFSMRFWSLFTLKHASVLPLIVHWTICSCVHFWWTFGQFASFSYCEYNCHKHTSRGACLGTCGYMIA